MALRNPLLLRAPLAAACLFLAWAGCSRKEAPVAAYLVPHRDEATVKEGWRTIPLSSPLLASDGDTFDIPAETTLSVVHLDGSFEQVTGPRKLRIKRVAETSLGFLAEPLSEAAGSVSPVQPADQPVRITSPVGVTRFLNPTVTWVAAPDTLYDVAIIDPADPAAPPRVLERTRPPVSFDALQAPLKRELPPDRILMVLVRESARQDQLGMSRFLTAADATSAALPDAPHELLREAVQAFREPPHRTGDAWLAWGKLPPGWRSSGLGQRLEVLLAAELGLQGTLGDLKTGPKSAPTRE